MNENLAEDTQRALQALARVPLAVAVVSAACPTQRSCATGTLTYASIDPAMLVTPLTRTGTTCALVLQTGELCISVLAEDQADIAVKAALKAKTDDKLAELGIPADDPPTGRAAPAIAGAAAALWCDLESTAEAGNHVLCIARVHASRTFDRSPLLRFDRRYHALGQTLAAPGERPYPL